jgi:hypothetical protein
MASEVNIANLALSHLGDSATVASLNPPEGSPQAERCATFYPLARDVLQEDFVWSFCRRRKALAQIADWQSSKWLFAYAAPAEMIRPIAVTPPGASTDGVGPAGYQDAQLFEVEGRSVGLVEGRQNTQVMILTNCPDAELFYTVKVTDTTKFSAKFVEALSWQLASMIAGPILKGEAGIKMTQSCLQMAKMLGEDAEVKDANKSLQQRGGYGGGGHIPDHIRSR